MKKNKVFILLTVFGLVFFNACKKHNIDIDRKSKDVISEPVIKKNVNNECIVLLKTLISKSSIKNSFVKNFNISIDDDKNIKMTIKLFNESDSSDNAVGWIIFDAPNKRLLDITNDIENPVKLKFDSIVWNKIIDCHFKSDSLFKIINPLTSECSDNSTEDGMEQVCIFKNISIEKVYQKTRGESEIDYANLLFANLPEHSMNQEINQNGLISIHYQVTSKKTEIEFLFEGGITTLIFDQQNTDVKRTVIYSAD